MRFCQWLQSTYPEVYQKHINNGWNGTVANVKTVVPEFTAYRLMNEYKKEYPRIISFKDWYKVTYPDEYHQAISNGWDGNVHNLCGYRHQLAGPGRRSEYRRLKKLGYLSQ